ncbi:hypothetical protein [Alkalitalea saponilacus]|uniref:Uncharacterized protein n=1 Tax=Alkalitalea saponilacus TaxID=889453 RepID=A0A1T5HRW2_9BACT|nr:hypothetical protein [Alkalitalea saponilacus]ASB50050.1 hypothetical protein CDL62_13340 [Alkalitalea saponilacus]SKC23434.1 hypothetical protein SAMN03080601_02708 [Alkalitalea saponilacus]
MKTIRQLFSTIFFLTIIHTGCTKDDVKCSDDFEFCAHINSEEYHKTGVYIDKYLNSLDANLNDEEGLNKLKDWLECNSCVENVEIFCVSCIKTYPPKSELIVLFNVNDQQTEKTLFIIMGAPLRFGHYQERNN